MEDRQFWNLRKIKRKIVRRLGKREKTRKPRETERALTKLAFWRADVEELKAAGAGDWGAGEKA